MRRSLDEVLRLGAYPRIRCWGRLAQVLCTTKPKKASLCARSAEPAPWIAN
jgi:hypothetical protein